MTDQQVQFGAKFATVGGTLTGIVVNLSAGDLVRTVILATVGALVSFSVSVLLRWLVKAYRRR